MRTTWVVPVLLALVCAPSFAQNNRSAVSVNGNDSNACTPALPCRSFTVAAAHTNAGGEVIALDTAGYGPFTVNKELTVSGAPGVHAAITTPSSIGIYVIAGSTDRVLIRNLVVIGSGGDAGIEADSGKEVQITGCTIRGFLNHQIISAVNLVVDHCVATSGAGSSSNGVSVYSSGVGIVNAVITNSLIDSQYAGIYASRNTAVVVTNSTIANNYLGAEAVIADLSGLVANMTLGYCTIASNSFGIATSVIAGNDANVYLYQNVVSYNATGVSISGGTVYSFGNNAFTGNGTDGAPVTPASMK